MKKVHMGLIVIISLLLIASVAWGGIWYYAQQDTVPDEVTAGGISIGGMKINEALELLDQYEKTLEQRTVKVEANGETADSKQWTVTQIGYSAEWIDVRNDLDQLRKGTVWERAKYRYHFPKQYELAQTFDRAVFEDLVNKQWGWIDKSESKDATRTITDKDEVTYKPHVDAFRIDVAALVEEVSPWVIVPSEELGKAPEASIHAKLPVGILHPKVTLEQLKDEGIERKIFEYTTDFRTSAAGRAYNVTAAANALNDWHLAPGEIFSYGKVIKLAEEKYGFKEAPVIQNGKLVPGVGGGICQVSSTLYNTIIRTGIEIVERRNHSLPVAYLPKGQDATFATGAIDFRFKNSTGKHLIIRTSVEGQKLTVKLFGTLPEDIRYDIESVTVKELPATVQQITDKSLKAGQRVVVQQGRSGTVVETYRSLIQDGKTVSRERITRDTYRAQPTIVHVGPGSSAPSATPTPKPSEQIVEDGI
ncbi:VanW family protein [Paenibacillus radicis (ex Gao et al. 2016)]|uniref:G5 domain-containing protein n=1 Tax=Paenibacillus radicis (ex Gao et al. 2016) TaxID=1737354 RepID=A0A917HN53_9BACL|nr:VanW family protein [Paenibacillus radicis (ex Gao et al. 2016)]GGG84681.1 hypothetical protein GCM10010918_48180 [Paenibacillus radicis (ex Gao et al. 2016)]